MTKDDANAAGLLSKMVRFVRNPATNWADIDSTQEDKESQYSKQMLKEMIERKRRNDFVRRREFDQLRKFRQRDALQGLRTEDAAGRPSFFQSSMASPDERAVTLKKIDEIEAQMSQQWWKSKQGADAEGTHPANLHAQDEAGAAARAFAPTAVASLPAHLDTMPLASSLFDDDSMAIGGFGATDAQMAPAPETVPFPVRMDTLPMQLLPEPQLEPEPFVHEPDLEEAAIRFANGDNAGAEAGLLDVLAQHQQDDIQRQLDIWMTLFDLYRATGQQDRFDTLAIDFAAGYSRSAPLWFSMPAQLGVEAAPAAPADDPTLRRELLWNAPPKLTVSSVAALQASIQRSPAPWTLVWQRLATVDDAAVPLLADQFTLWADRPGQFVFAGVEQFNHLLQAMTESGDRTSGPEWWRLRMAVLRLMGRPDEFEMVALDYCVTYEVSPPSWIASRCAYTDDLVQAPGQTAAATTSDHLYSELGDFSLSAPLEAAPAATLIGMIDGDATPWLQPFEALFQPGIPLTIACDRLIRVDFAAAGSVLNWAAEQQAQGRTVYFHNLQRLVAVFFNVIGISEHAWIIPRKN